jgi:signal transduction histidine kinase
VRLQQVFWNVLRNSVKVMRGDSLCYGGLGFGLVMARQLVEMHAGQICARRKIKLARLVKRQLQPH